MTNAKFLLLIFLVACLTLGGFFWKWHNRPEAHVARGYQLHNEGRYRDAVSEFRAAADLQPESAKAHEALGDALLCVNHRLEPFGQHEITEVGNPAPPKELAEAIGEYRKAIQLEPKDAFYHFDLASSLDTQGNQTEAIAEYRKTISLLPAIDAKPVDWDAPGQTNLQLQSHTNVNQQYHDACWCLAQDLQRQRKYHESIAWYRRSIASKPDDNSTRMMLAKALNESGNRTGARQVWQQVVHHDDQGEAPEARKLLAAYPE